MAVLTRASWNQGSSRLLHDGNQTEVLENPTLKGETVLHIEPTRGGQKSEMTTFAKQFGSDRPEVTVQVAPAREFESWP